MKTRTLELLPIILLMTILVGCNSENTVSKNPSEDPSHETSQVVEAKPAYAFLTYGDQFPYGAAFSTTVETILESINSYSLFQRTITMENMTITEMNDGSNTMRYAYSESGHETLEIYTDKDTGYIICGSWITDMNYYDYKYSETMNDIYSQASTVLSTITSQTASTLTSEYYFNQIRENAKNAFNKEGICKRTSYKDGVALSIVTSDTNRLYIRITAINEPNYDAWSSEAKTIQEPTTATQDTSPLLLNELDVAERLVNERHQIFKHTVTFDNQTFSMTAGNTGRGAYSVIGAEPIRPNIVMRELYEQVGDSIVYSVYLYVLDDYYFIGYKPTPRVEIILTFQCETDRLYQYDLEKNQELNTFVNTIVEEFEKTYPLGEEKKALSLTDLNNFDFLFYCIKAETEYWKSHRISFENEVFTISIYGDTPDADTAQIGTDQYYTLYTENNIKVMCLKGYNKNSSVNYLKIEFYKVNEETREDGELYITYNYYLEITLECLSDPEFDKGLNQCPDYMNFIKEIAKAMAN